MFCMINLLRISLLWLGVVQVLSGAGPIVVAHRGASHDAPENTLPAFRLAWEQGADAIEGDFFLTADGKIVCTHDRVTGRLNPMKVKLEVARSTLAELQKLDIGAWKGEEWEGERMPTLEEVMETVPDGKRLLIEVKCGPEILPALKKVIRASSLEPGQITVISFKKAVVLESKRSMPGIQAFWLCSFKRDKKTGDVEPSEASVLESLELLGADGFSCGDHNSLNAEFVQKVRTQGVEMHCWTIDDPKRAHELAAMGMHSITTNRPALVRESLAREGGARLEN